MCPTPCTQWRCRGGGGWWGVTVKKLTKRGEKRGKIWKKRQKSEGSWLRPSWQIGLAMLYWSYRGVRKSGPFHFQWLSEIQIIFTPHGMHPIEGFGIPGFFHPIDRRKSEQFVSFIYTTYRGIRKSGLFFRSIWTGNPGFLASYSQKSGFFGQVALGNPAFFRFEKLPFYRGCAHIIWNSPML